TWTFPKRPPAKCNYKLCSEPLACVKDEESYKCVPCEEAGGKEVLQFPSKGVSDYVFVENAFTVSLTAFTVATKNYIEFTIDDIAKDMNVLANRPCSYKNRSVITVL
ncbi:hypothetical protein QZH41_012964, partial [Actinostola sp. cb2023]